jgi:leucyl-tRNA synthetase
MGVPAHDQRDFEFARKYGIPIRTVVAPPDWNGSDLQAAHVEGGHMVNSGQFNGLTDQQMVDSICDFPGKGMGGRPLPTDEDWLISGKYWERPYLWSTATGVESRHSGKDLPVLLPPDVEFKPTGDLSNTAIIREH